MNKELPSRFYVSITGLRPKNFWTTFLFWRHAIPCKIQADSARGVLFSDVKKMNKVQHTLTAWESKDHMKAYIHSGAHLKALKSFRKIAVGKTFGFDTDRIPAWDEVHELWLKNGKEY
jgi:ribosomal protein L14E/L6E/L27E